MILKYLKILFREYYYLRLTKKSVYYIIYTIFINIPHAPEEQF